MLGYSRERKKVIEYFDPSDRRNINGLISDSSYKNKK